MPVSKSDMKITVLTSNALRHRYFANVIAAHFPLAGIVTEPKHDYFDKQREESELVRGHFVSLAEYEKKYFSRYPDFPQGDILEIEKRKINDPQTVSWVKARQPQFILLFVTGILGEGWLQTFPDKIINLHLGLSPYYRGAATLFWPFVNDDLSGVGVTYHLATSRVDAGDILARFRPELKIGDNYYDVTNKAIRNAIDRVAEVITGYAEGRLVPVEQKASADCKLYKKKDFNEDVLRKVMAKYKQGLTQERIDFARRHDRCPINT